MDNPEGAEAEEFLWSLGVGEALPPWLKELRKQERDRGLNLGPRQSAPRPQRPGIGPQRAWSGDEASEAEAVRLPTPSKPSAAPKPVPVPKPVAPVQVAEISPVAPVTLGASASASSQERRVDPDDGKAYSLEEIMSKYKGIYSDAEIEAYFRNDCKLAQEAAETVKAVVEEPRIVLQPSREAAVQKPRLSIKEWLASLDESGFLGQYHDAIAAKLDSVEQIVDVYGKADGTVDKQFFTDVGITKLGHKRLFEKWFRDRVNSV